MRRAISSVVPLLALAAGAHACGRVGAPTAVPPDTCPTGYICEAACSNGSACPGSPYGETYDAADDVAFGDGGPDDDALSDGGEEATAYPDGSTAPKSSTMLILTHDVVDAKFSSALSAVVMASASPSSTLHIYVPSTNSDQTVVLPEVPVAVAVDKTGLMAAIAYDAHVSWIDLQAASIKTTCPLSSDAYDVAISSTGIAYVLPATDASLHVIDLTSCAETIVQAPIDLESHSHVALHPSETELFALDQGYDPEEVAACAVGTNPIMCGDSLSMNDWGTYEFGLGLWMSTDGTRLYTGSGVTLSMPAGLASGSCSYSGTLEAVPNSVIQYLSDAPAAGRVAFIPGAYDSFDGEPGPVVAYDAVVRVHDSQYLQFIAQYELAPFTAGAEVGATAHGLFVFSTPAMSALYVIVAAEADDAGPSAYGIETITP